MKKLIILVSLLPTVVFAEDFYLVCEGLEQTYIDDKKIANEEIIKGIEVTSKFLAYDNIYFDNVDGTSFSMKSNNISFSLNSFEDYKIIFQIEGKVDRISGAISVRTSMFKAKSAIYFDGKCKKTNKKAF